MRGSVGRSTHCEEASNGYPTGNLNMLGVKLDLVDLENFQRPIDR
jgi:hypothetical protein